MQIEITEEKLALVLHAIAKREQITPSEVAERFLNRGFLAVALELIAKRKAQQAQSSGREEDTPSVIIVDPCSEEALRALCGDQWHLCYFLMTCSLLPGAQGENGIG